MKLDYSKTINEQQEVFGYYKNNYLSYQLEIERLNNRIDKAIEYIENNYCMCLLDKSIINSKELLDILKGSDKE